MQNRTDLYKSIFNDAQDGLIIEYKVTVNETATYEQNQLVGGTITEALFGKLSIGNLVSKCFDMSYVKNSDVVIPKGASLTVWYRISDGSRVSEWVKKGKFYVDKRKTRNGITYLTSYDAAMKANAVYMRDGEWATTDALALYTELRTILGLQAHTATVSTIQSDNYTITKSPSIGENGSTILEVLSWLGTLYGCNWIVTENEELALVPIMPDEYVAYKSSVDTDFADAETEIDRVIIYTDAGGENYVRYPRVPWSQWDAMTGTVLEGISIYADWDDISDIADRVIGAKYRGFSSTAVSEDPAVQIGDGITIEGNDVTLVKRVLIFGKDFAEMSAPYEEELESEYPTISTETRKLRRSIEFTGASLSVLDNKIIAEVTARQNGEVKSVKQQYYLSTSDYVPAQGQWQDTIPNTIEEGKYVWTRMYIIYNDDTYTTTDPVLGLDALYQGNVTNSSRITEESDRITAEVSRSTEKDSLVDTEMIQLQQTASEFGVWYTKQSGQTKSQAEMDMAEAAESAVDAYDTQVQNYMRYDGPTNTLELGGTGSPFKSKLDNTRLAFTGESGEDAAWISNNQLYGNQFVVPAGSNGKWVMSTNSSGHFQIRWVDD